MEYISHGLKRKYENYCGTVLFWAGCTAYFLTITVLNLHNRFEGVLGVSYGAVLYVYCLLAAEGKRSDFFLLSIAWVLLAFISAYVMFAVWGMVRGEKLAMLLDTEEQAHMYFSLAAGVLRFSLGRMVLAVYRRRKQKKLLVEDWMMALIVVDAIHREKHRTKSALCFSFCLLDGGVVQFAPSLNYSV